MDKILSFIIPSYNSEKVLCKCLDSFLCEEAKDYIEVIVVNDGSADNTADIAKEYCDKKPDVFRLMNQENKGHGGALNTGLEAAKAKYDGAIIAIVSPLFSFFAKSDAIFDVSFAFLTGAPKTIKFSIVVSVSS